MHTHTQIFLTRHMRKHTHAHIHTTATADANILTRHMHIHTRTHTHITAKADGSGGSSSIPPAIAQTHRSTQAHKQRPQSAREASHNHTHTHTLGSQHRTNSSDIPNGGECDHVKGGGLLGRLLSPTSSHGTPESILYPDTPGTSKFLVFSREYFCLG